MTLLLSTALGGTMWVHVLDVGQGDSILLETPAGDTILIDAATGGARVADQIEALGVDELDLVVVTHPHADHMGGMRSVVVRYPVELYLDSGMEHTTKSYRALMGALDQYEVEHRAAVRGESFTFDDDIVVTVLWPGTTLLRDTRSDLNSNSVVLRVDHGEDCFLFTGDSEEPTERALLGGGLEQCDVLKVAHHGSNHSTTDSFLRAVDPDIALISAGQDNRYGHPGEETLERLERQGVAIYRTDDSGNLALASTGHGVQVTDGVRWTETGDSGPVVVDADPGRGGTVTVAPEYTDPVGVDPTEVPNLSGVRGAPPPPLEESPRRRGCLARFRPPRSQP